jgi:hypothetical protein
MNFYLKEFNSLDLKQSIYILSLFFLTACAGSKMLSPSEYLDWCAKESLNYTVSDTLQQVSFSLKYISNEQDAANCLKTACMSEEEIKSELLKNKTNQQFLLRIQVFKPGRDVFDYSGNKNNFPSNQRQKYFAFDMKNDVKMISKMGDTITCTYWFYEPSMAGSGIANVSIGFKPIAQNEMQSLLIFDRVFTGEYSTINLSKLPYNNFPQLKIKAEKK